MRNILLSVLLLSSITAVGQEYIYGLQFASGQLKMAKAEIGTGDVEVLSAAPLSADGFSQGVADFDPFGKRYFYVRGGRLYSVDAQTGDLLSNPLIENPTDAVEPITNLAYNWLDGVMYGVMHEYISGVTKLRLVSVDMNTGDLTILSSEPIINGGFLSGNTDIDVLGRRYFLVTGSRRYVVDLDSGELLDSDMLTMPFANGNEYLNNIAYDWINDELYGLHFYTPTPIDSYGPTCQGQLRLAKVDSTGLVEVISTAMISPDCFSQGDSDIDPVGGRYFYIRQGRVYEVSLSDGSLISQSLLANPNSAVAAIINMTFDDLIVPNAAPVDMDMGAAEEMQGTSMTLGAWVGDDEVEYLWSTGETSASIEISQAGSYSVSITKGSFTAYGEKQILSPTSLPEIDEVSVSLYPNPAQGSFRLKGQLADIRQVRIRDAQGRLVRSYTRSAEYDVNLAKGIYSVEIVQNNSSSMLQLVID